MTIKRNKYALIACSGIHFDEDVFCGRPYVALTAYKDNFGFEFGGNTITIGVYDSDDYDLGLVYETDSEHFFDVLHELINWMADHEKGVVSLEKCRDAFDLFPDCGCKREVW